MTEDSVFALLMKDNPTRDMCFYTGLEETLHQRLLGCPEPQLLLIIEGECIIEDDQKFCGMHAQDGLVIPAHHTVKIRSGHIGKIQALIFNLSPELLGKIAIALYRAELQNPKDALDISDSFPVYFPQCARQVVKSIQSYQESELFCPQELFELKKQELVQTLLMDTHNELFMRFALFHALRQPIFKKYFLHNGIIAERTVKEIASQSGKSLTSFRMQFKRSHGTTPGQWKRNKRLDQAVKMLMTSNKSIAEISSEIGYQSVSHFIQVFKQKHGHTPQKIRLLLVQGLISIENF